MRSSKKRLVILSGLALAVFCGIAFLVVVRKEESFEARVERQRDEARQYAAKITPKLTHDENISGEWHRIRSTVPASWRVFSRSGEMSVRYDDQVFDGSYKILDKKTIETKYRFDGEIHRWTFGFLNGELIMINQATCWVEEYRRIPEGAIGMWQSGVLPWGDDPNQR